MAGIKIPVHGYTDGIERLKKQVSGLFCKLADA